MIVHQGSVYGIDTLHTSDKTIPTNRAFQIVQLPSHPENLRPTTARTNVTVCVTVTRAVLTRMRKRWCPLDGFRQVLDASGFDESLKFTCSACGEEINYFVNTCLGESESRVFQIVWGDANRRWRGTRTFAD